MLTEVKLLDMRYPTEQSKQSRRWATFFCSYCEEEFDGQRDSYKRQDHCGCNRGANRKVHGMTGTRPYSIWGNMKSRCTNTTIPNYPRYGGRGITYNPKWETFIGFWEDMQEGYDDNFEIDRIDVNLGYYKENCRWITKRENIQKMHQDKNDYIEYLEHKIEELERRLTDG